MLKVAVVVLADTETHGDLARVANALEAVKEFKEAGDTIQLIFDGAASKWAVELSNPGHKLHALYQAVQDRVTGVCGYCASAFGVKDELQACGARLMTEYEGHPSFRRLLSEGFQVITF